MNGTMTMTNVHPLLFKKVCILENERISKVFIFPKYPQAIFKCLQKLKNDTMTENQRKDFVIFLPDHIYGFSDVVVVLQSLIH